MLEIARFACSVSGQNVISTLHTTKYFFLKKGFEDRNWRWQLQNSKTHERYHLRNLWLLWLGPSYSQMQNNWFFKIRICVCARAVCAGCCCSEKRFWKWCEKGQLHFRFIVTSVLLLWGRSKVHSTMWAGLINFALWQLTRSFLFSYILSKQNVKAVFLHNFYNFLSHYYYVRMYLPRNRIAVVLFLIGC